MKHTLKALCWCSLDGNFGSLYLTAQCVVVSSRKPFTGGAPRLIRFHSDSRRQLWDGTRPSDRARVNAAQDGTTEGRAAGGGNPTEAPPRLRSVSERRKRYLEGGASVESRARCRCHPPATCPLVVAHLASVPDITEQMPRTGFATSQAIR